MKKISTLFKKDPNDLGRVINEIRPENEWVYRKCIATRKYDGTACAIINGLLYKRYDAKRKKGKWKTPPFGAIECQPPDEHTGHWPHWVICAPSDPSDKYYFEAMKNIMNEIDRIPKDGTYELCGPKIQGNPEKLNTHLLIEHGSEQVYPDDLSFDGLRGFLSDEDIEGIVFHSPEGRMCKIRKSDFGIKRKQ